MAISPVTNETAPPGAPPAVATPAPRRRAGLRRLGLKLLLLAVSLTAGLALAEVGLRLFGIDRPLVWQPDPEVGWHHIPGARMRWTEEGDGLVEINSLGYRDRPRQLEKTPGTFRIAVFGDSMTEAVQVNLDQTYTYLLEERLRASGRSVEVLNFGVDSYGPVQELLLFKREAPRYKPDLVVLALFVDNDVADSHPALANGHDRRVFLHPGDGGLRFDHRPAQRTYDEYHAEPVHFLREHLATYRVLSQMRRRWKEHSGQASTGGGFPKRYEVYDTSPRPEWEEGWRFLERAVLEFDAEARRQGIPLVIVSVPAGQVVNAAGWEKQLDLHPAMRERSWDLEGPERRLERFAREHGLVLVQPYREFRTASQDPPLFFGSVGHFTPHGHALLAEHIEASLKARALLPR